MQKENINFACDIMYSQVVTHLSTNMTKRSLNSLTGKHRPNSKYKLIARLLSIISVNPFFKIIF